MVNLLPERMINNDCLMCESFQASLKQEKYGIMGAIKQEYKSCPYSNSTGCPLLGKEIVMETVIRPKQHKALRPMTATTTDSGYAVSAAIRFRNDPCLPIGYEKIGSALNMPALTSSEVRVHRTKHEAHQ